MNSYKNEKIIKIGGQDILLRPTFENCEALETALGFGLPVLAHNLSKQKLPGMSDMAKVIYHCQAQKLITQEEIWKLVMAEGMMVMSDILIFVGQITAGDKFSTVEKKSQAPLESQP